MTASWVPVPEGSDFPLANLPYGIASDEVADARVVVAIGDHALDLAGAHDLLADLVPPEVLAHHCLNPLMALGRQSWDALRRRLTDLLGDDRHQTAVEPFLVPRSRLQMHLPFEVADYVDFYSSENHAANVGRMFRPHGEALPPNWKHLPIGYHGRAGTVVVSGTDIVRPHGQRRAPGATLPGFGPTRRLDIEVEVGFVVGTPSPLGAPVPASAFADHVFGVVLVNDWSAREIQAWEYQPLGPFLAKSFATSVSPWVVPLAALAAARVPGPEQEPPPLPYLQRAEPWGLDLDLELSLGDAWTEPVVVSRPPFASMYWTADQQLAHLTANGAALRTGDLYASGTVSGPEREQRGSFLELSWSGAEPLVLPSGREVTFLLDGDVVTIRGTFATTDGGRAGFGDLTATVEPALG